MLPESRRCPYAGADLLGLSRDVGGCSGFDYDDGAAAPPCVEDEDDISEQRLQELQDQQDERSQLMMQLCSDGFSFCDVKDEPRFVFDESLCLPVQLTVLSDLAPIVRSPVVSMAAKDDCLAVTDGYFVYLFELLNSASTAASASSSASFSSSGGGGGAGRLRCRRSFRVLPSGYSDFRISCVRLQTRDLMYASGNLVLEASELTAGCLVMTNSMGQLLSYKVYNDGHVSGFDFDQSGGIFLCYCGQRKAISRIVKLSSDLKHLFHLDIDWDKIPKQISCCWDSNETWVSGQWGGNGGFLLSMRSHDPKGIGEVNSWLKPSAWRFERLMPSQLLGLSEGRLLTVNAASQEGSL
uniref:Uncharacterized protein n=1 Tax=Macrostomum lignano TaxID=282301 RepID=A0A1I8HFH7_9PLAT